MRARRAEMIPFEAIRDDGPVEATAGGFHGLPEKPAKATDNRGNWRGGTVQVEALEAALRKRRHVGPGWLFPSPGNPERAVR